MPMLQADQDPCLGRAFQQRSWAGPPASTGEADRHTFQQAGLGMLGAVLLGRLLVVREGLSPDGDVEKIRVGVAGAALAALADYALVDDVAQLALESIPVELDDGVRVVQADAEGTGGVAAEVPRQPVAQVASRRAEGAAHQRHAGEAVVRKPHVLADDRVRHLRQGILAVLHIYSSAIGGGAGDGALPDRQAR